MPQDKEQLEREVKKSDESKSYLYDSWIVDSTTHEEPNYEYSEGEGRED